MVKDVDDADNNGDVDGDRDAKDDDGTAAAVVFK